MSVSFVIGQCDYFGFTFTGHSNDLNNWMQNYYISLGGALKVQGEGGGLAGCWYSADSLMTTFERKQHIMLLKWLDRQKSNAKYISLEGALKCYRCSSTKDWDECVDIQQDFDCPYDSDLCYKLLFKSKKEHVQEENYRKGCATSENFTQFNKELCNMKDFGPGTMCEISWCTGDLCNAAALPMVTAISFIVCACLAFLY